VGLKIDERKLPPGLRSFKCPACREAVPVSLLNIPPSPEPETETVLLRPTKFKSPGRITVVANDSTPEQVFPLEEGIHIMGRQSPTSGATLPIVTSDRMMSREHIRLEVSKDERGRYKHYLSDNKSRNNTLYKGSCLSAGEVAVLSDNDEIIIGNTLLRFNG
jgi:hypothetical protein